MAELPSGVVTFLFTDIARPLQGNAGAVRALDRTRQLDA
jgi:hypothetical protein